MIVSCILFILFCAIEVYYYLVLINIYECTEMVEFAYFLVFYLTFVVVNVAVYQLQQITWMLF